MLLPKLASGQSGEFFLCLNTSSVFRFCVMRPERLAIRALAERLQRTQSDAVRLVVREAASESLPSLARLQNPEERGGPPMLPPEPLPDPEDAEARGAGPLLCAGPLARGANSTRASKQKPSSRHLRRAGGYRARAGRPRKADPWTKHRTS